jgi:hypothetical protein
MLKLLALLLVLTTTAYADGNGIERGSYRGENLAAKIPTYILDMIEKKMLKNCDTSHLSVIRIESVEIQKVVLDQNFADTSYTVVLWAPGDDQVKRERIYVNVYEFSLGLVYEENKTITIDVVSDDVHCE